MFQLAKCALARSAAAMIGTALLVAGTASANATQWRGYGAATGPDGGISTYSNFGRCYGGVCRSKQTVVGPYGGKFTRHGRTTCNGHGVCRTTTTIVGPGGRMVTRTSTIHRH